jgi:predicted nucleic acid-binding protein
VIGVDTNLLVALAIADHPRHSSAYAECEKLLQGWEKFALSSSIVAEFLHTVTDQRRFQPPHAMPSAIAWFREWSLRCEPTWLHETKFSIDLWLRWMDQYRLGRKRILDTRYAALLHSNNVKRLVTNNPDDFRIFGVFEIVTF